MKSTIKIRSKLATLLYEKRVTAEELSEMTKLPLPRIMGYVENTLDAVSLDEMGRMLSALGCHEISDILEEIIVTEGDVDAEDAPPMMEGEWYSPCPVSPDGKHRWYKDQAVSDTIYQEFCCQACKRRLSVIL